MHKLKITNCKNHIQEIILPQGVHTIGRELDSTVRLEGEGVSRLHARISITGPNCEISDIQSKNGTFINHSRITTSCLFDEDIINIGEFNLQFTSDTARSHAPRPGPGPARLAAPLTRKKRFTALTVTIISLLLTLIMFSGLVYTSVRYKKTVLQLAERTAQYLAARNKEALYLGEYGSLDFSRLPPPVTTIAIWDRNGILRGQKPQGKELSVKPSDSARMVRSGKTVGVTVPVSYQSVRVGTLWIEYKI